MRTQEKPALELFTDVALALYTALWYLKVAEYIKMIDPFYINKLDRKIQGNAFKIDWRWMFK